MKKLIICAAALATALFAGSCQQELLDTAGSSTVTYTVEVPGVATKAIGDATNVNQLIYEVWRTGTAKDITLNPSAAGAAEPRTELLYRKTAVVNDRVATFEVDLVKNQNYTILFWAQVVDANGVNAYYNTGDLRSVTLTDEPLGAFNEARAAFYGIDFIEAGNQKAQQKVTLTRPFAQVNLGTVERNAQAMGYKLTVAHTSVTIKGASKKFNVATGVASAEDNDCADLTFASKAPFMPEGKVEKLNGTYEWIAMDYIFVPENQATLAVDYTITTNHGVVSNSISNLPTQKNYRTNIIGNLLTSKTDYIVDINANWTSENTHGTDTEAIQSALDNAMPGSEIHLHPGVNYGTLYLRPIEGGAQTKVVDWIGNNYRFETYSLFENITIVGAEGATVDAIEIEGGTYYNSEHSQADKYPIMLSLIELKNVVIDGVTFTGKGGYDPQGHGNAINLSGNNIKVDGLTIKNCTLNNPENNARLIYKTESTTTEHKYTYDDQTKALQEYTFTPSLKNITVTGTTFNGGYIGLELRETENVTITNNTFNVADRNILLPVNTGCTYSGKVTITGNVSNNAKQRFVRMSGAGDAEVVITENTINNYQGADADYIKVTDGTNVNIQKNPISYGGIIYEINLKNDETVTLPAKEGDRTVLVKGKGTLVLNGTAITTTEGPAIELAEGAKVTLRVINGNVNITGATNGIQVPNSAELTVTGEGSLNVLGKAGSGIGYASTSEKTNTAGKITISNLSSLTAKGTGEHAYGIGSKASHVRIEKSTINYACGGHIQPTFINDTKYGKSEPEGAPAIGGEKIDIVESIIEKADGGSKAAAIGAEFWQSTSIEIVNSTILEANGGNASAGIGGSRYAEGDKYNVSIKIQNSKVTATGGQHGAGIGSGYDTHCNGQNYTATNHIEIDETSTITAKGGKYAAGIGTGFHSAYLTGSIAAGATINAESGEAFYKDSYTTAQNIGYGVVDPAREYSGENANIKFTVAGNVIGTPYGIPVAKVGNTEYKSIDEAIAAWTNNTTLTLLADVTLSDVVTLKSTEHHILNLATYTMTAASGMNAFEIKACGTGDAERTAITINADATNPGGINAGSKSIIYYKYADGGISVNDRPIIKINGGVFTGTTSAWGSAGIYTIGTEARKCATLDITGGVFNCSINGSGKSKLLISGGIFHYSVGSQGDSTAYRLISGGTFKTLGFMTADSNNTKFWFGTSMGNSNVGLYINDDNYLVVGGPVITEFGDKFAAKATNATKWSSYLQYSSAAANGLYYTNAEMAITKHGEANVDLK